MNTTLMTQYPILDDKKDRQNMKNQYYPNEKDLKAKKPRLFSEDAFQYSKARHTIVLVIYWASEILRYITDIWQETAQKSHI